MRVKLLGGHLALGAAIVLAVAADAARAQQVQQAPEATIPERQSVFERARPDYDPLGIRLGSFLAYPTARLAETFDSNVFATTNNTRNDFYTTFNPGVAIRSDWNVHSVALQASSLTKRYTSLVSENITNLLVAGSGRLDILRDIYVRGGAGYQLLHEDRSSPDSLVTGKKPVEYHVTSANLGYVHEAARLGARVDATVDSYSFNNATSNTGATLIQKDRDRIVYAITPRVSYEIVPGYHAFAQASGNLRDYVAKTDQRGFHRSSHGYEADVGTAIDLTHVINGEVYVGYLSQYYDDTRLPTNRGVGFGGNLLWNVTQLTSLRATMARTIEETTQFASFGAAAVDASGYIQSAVKLTAEHELLRNVLLSAYASYVNSNYNGINRTDDQYEANIEGRYLINRILTVSADFTYTKRESNVIGVAYDRAIGMLALRAGF